MSKTPKHLLGRLFGTCNGMEQESLYEQSLDYFLTPLQPLLEDDGVTEILINGTDQIFFEKEGELHRSSIRFPDEPWLASLAQNVAEYVGRKLGTQHHSLSGRLPENSCAKGSRIHVVAPPSSRSGYCISIHRFKQRCHSLAELVDLGSISEEAADFLRLAVKMKCNIAISGGTGTGKTTMLNALATAIDPQERILVIEETSELKLSQPHTVYFETQQGDAHKRGEVTVRDLFVDSLRMRPDRIIIGEVRRGEALDMMQSMLSGHSGTLTTVHANSAIDALSRLETLCLMTEESLPHYVARQQVASAIHLVVQIERLRGHRRVKSICECRGVDYRDRYRLRPIFRTDFDGHERGPAEPELRPCGRRPACARNARGHVSPSDFPNLSWMFADKAPVPTANDGHYILSFNTV